ncbi:MAG: hypothetical protein ACE5J7_04960 [Candidatus Aenigmatarchaeota archaeon]
MKKQHMIPIVFIIIIMLSAPVFSMVREAGEESSEQEFISLEIGLITLAGAGGIFAFIKKEKIFMRKHTFRFEKIKKKLREDEYED